MTCISSPIGSQSKRNLTVSRDVKKMGETERKRTKYTLFENKTVDVFISVPYPVLRTGSTEETSRHNLKKCWLERKTSTQAKQIYLSISQLDILSREKGGFRIILVQPGGKSFEPISIRDVVATSAHLKKKPSDICIPDYWRNTTKGA